MRANDMTTTAWPVRAKRPVVIAAVTGMVLASGLAIGLLWRFDPAESRFFPPCMLHKLTGLHCPGCGGTRAMHALVHGHLIQALLLNPMLIAGAPALAALLFWNRRRRRRGLPEIRYLALGIAVAFISYMVLRNVPAPETGWLRPGNIGELHIDKPTGEASQ